MTSPKQAARHDLRETDGRYAVGFDAVCACGHPKGEHLAGRSGNSLGACIHYDLPGDGVDCGCERFRKAR